MKKWHFEKWHFYYDLLCPIIVIGESAIANVRARPLFIGQRRGVFDVGDRVNIVNMYVAELHMFTGLAKPAFKVYLNTPLFAGSLLIG